ncbi:MAG: hypothetical protein ABW185_11025 [Sedimenticola sp.]
MHKGQRRATCGHITGATDNHDEKCLSCCGCSSEHPCPVSLFWGATTWAQVATSRTYAKRNVTVPRKSTVGKPGSRARSRVTDSSTAKSVGKSVTGEIESTGSCELQAQSETLVYDLKGNGGTDGVTLVQSTVDEVVPRGLTDLDDGFQPVQQLAVHPSDQDSGRSDRSAVDRPVGAGDRPAGDRPVSAEDRWDGDRYDRPVGAYGDRPAGDRPVRGSGRSVRDRPVNTRGRRTGDRPVGRPVVDTDRSADGRRYDRSVGASGDEAQTGHDQALIPLGEDAHRSSRDVAKRYDRQRRRQHSYSGGRYRSRSKTPPKAYRTRRHSSHRRSSYRAKSLFGSSESSSEESSGRYERSRKRRRSRSPSSGHDGKRHRAGRKTETAFMGQMRDMVSSMVSSQVKALGPHQPVASNVAISTGAQTRSGQVIALPQARENDFTPLDTRSCTTGRDSVVTSFVPEEGEWVELSDEEEPEVVEAESHELPPAPFLNAVRTIYALLPESVCPQPPVPVPRVTSLYEAESPQTNRDVPRLPFSPTVSGLVTSLETVIATNRAKAKGWAGSLTKTPRLKNQCSEKFYKPHNKVWPVEPPPLDLDANLIGAKGLGYPDTGSAKLIKGIDEGIRSLVAMASHIDLCLGAARKVGDDEVNLDSLLQSAARASRHILTKSLAMSADILLSRRDNVIRASSLIKGQGRETLRRAPLGSETLLGGLCATVSKADLEDRQRLHLRGLASSRPPPTAFRREVKSQFPSRGRARPSGPRFTSGAGRGVGAPVSAPTVPPVRGRGFARSRGSFSSRGPRRGSR